MQSRLKEKLRAFIYHNNPDLMLRLQESHSVDQYLNEKVNMVSPMVDQLLSEGRPLYILEELCLDTMTEELKPSRYLYICSVMEEEFAGEYERMRENGTLTYEVVNLMEACKGIFSDFDFSSENEANRFLRYAIIGQVHEYLS